jgi:FkbM family methyltransferase
MSESIHHWKRLAGLLFGYLRCYLSKYGLVRAYSAWRQLHAKLPKDSHLIRAPWKEDRPIWLRPGSPDVGTFEHVFLWDGYRIDLPFVPQTILDLGGNVGLASAWFASQYQSAKIVIVEPDQANFAVLLKNFEHRNGVSCIRAAVGSKDGFAKCENPSVLSHSFRFVESDAGGEIPVLSIRSIMKVANSELPDFIKIDVEGAEEGLFSEESLRGEWLPSAKAIAVEIHSEAARLVIEKALPIGVWQHTRRGETDFFVRKVSAALSA